MQPSPPACTSITHIKNKSHFKTKNEYLLTEEMLSLINPIDTRIVRSVSTIFLVIPSCSATIHLSHKREYSSKICMHLDQLHN